MITKKLSEIAKLVNGYAFKSEKYVDSGVRVIRIANVQDGYISDEQPCFYPIDCLSFLGETILQENDLLMSLTGNVGRVAIISKDILPAGLNQRVECIRPNKDISKEYLYHFFKSAKFRLEAVKNSTGCAQLNMSTKWLGNYEIPIYDAITTNEINKTLNNIEKAIDSMRYQLSLLDELIKSRFIEMFGDPDLSEQLTSWKLVSDFAEVLTGTTPSTQDEKNWDGDILWVTPAEIKKDAFWLFDTERKITEKGRKSKSLQLMPIGTVLLSTRAPIGKVAIVGKEMTCNQGFKNFNCDGTVNPIYLYFLLKYNESYLNSIGSGTTFREVSKSKIEKLKMPIPSKDKQDGFAAFVEQIDKLKFIAHL